MVDRVVRPSSPMGRVTWTETVRSGLEFARSYLMPGTLARAPIYPRLRVRPEDRFFILLLVNSLVYVATQRTLRQTRGREGGRAGGGGQTRSMGGSSPAR